MKSQSTFDMDELEQRCVRFENEWRTNGPPDIGQYVVDLDETTSGQLLTELVALDMEFNLRHRGNLERHLENYLTRFNGQIPTASIADLILKEYRYHQQWGDRPTIGEYLSRFREFADQIDVPMREYASQVTPTVVGVFWQTELRFKMPLLRQPLVIGRQQSSDPPPFASSTGFDGERLVIAARGETLISRSHVRLEIVCRDGVKITNTSQYPIKIELSDEILPEGEMVVHRPTVFKIENLALRLSNR